MSVVTAVIEAAANGPEPIGASAERDIGTRDRNIAAARYDFAKGSLMNYTFTQTQQLAI